MTADGTGVVSHAGTVLLGELADRIGLTAALSEATDGLRQRRAGHDPGWVLVDVAVAIADGATTISDVQALADQHGLHGPAGSVASTPTIWRVLAGIDTAMLGEIRQARAVARDRAWLGRGELTGAELPGSRAAGRILEQVVIDLDATLVTAHWRQGRRQRQLQGRIRPSPARGVAGQHRRGSRGSTSSWECWQQHRHRSPGRAGPGPDPATRPMASHERPGPGPG